VIWRRIGVGVGAFVALSVGILAAVGPPAARLTGAAPADGARLSVAPTEVWLTFNGAIDPEQFHIGVSTADGRVVTTGAPRLAGSRILVPVSIHNGGAFLVGYHVRLAQGSEITGVSRFTLALNGSPAPTVSAAPASTVSAAPAPTVSAAPAVAGGSDDGHGHLNDPLSLALLGISGLLALAVLWLLVRRPRTG